MNDNLIMTFFLEEGSIILNQGIIEALGKPEHVQVRFNEKTLQLILRACQLEEEQAIVVQKAEMPELAGRRLIKKIRTLAGWPDEGTRFVYGVYLPEYNAVGFNLTDARLVSEYVER